MSNVKRTEIGKRLQSIVDARAASIAAVNAFTAADATASAAAGIGTSSAVAGAIRKPWGIRAIKRIPRIIGNRSFNIPFTLMGGGIIAGTRILANYRSKLRSTQNTGIQKFVFGPGYPVWFKTRGMSHENLGASGDLALGLSNMRHSSII